MVQIKKKVKLKQKNAGKENSGDNLILTCIKTWVKNHWKATITTVVVIAVIIFICKQCGFIPFGDSDASQNPIPADTTQVDTQKKAPVVATADSVATPEEETTVGNDEVTDGADVVSVTEEPQKTAEETVTPPVSQSGDLTVDAKKAIRGDFGNGAERRKNLGANYDKVQAVVNRMYREGNLYW